MIQSWSALAPGYGVWPHFSARATKGLLGIGDRFRKAPVQVNFQRPILLSQDGRESGMEGKRVRLKRRLARRGAPDFKMSKNNLDKPGPMGSGGSVCMCGCQLSPTWSPEACWEARLGRGGKPQQNELANTPHAISQGSQRSPRTCGVLGRVGKMHYLYALGRTECGISRSLLLKRSPDVGVG